MITFAYFWLFMTILTWVFVGVSTGKEFTAAVIQRREAMQKNPNQQFPPITIIYQNMFYQGVIWPCFWAIQMIENYMVNKHDRSA